MDVHSERKHALLSASSADRWLNCTPSAVLEAAFPEGTSDASEEGTAAHELAELLIAKYMGADRPIVIEEGIQRIQQSKWYNTEFEDYVNMYVSFVLEKTYKAMQTDVNTVSLTEQKLDFSMYVPEGFGTVDHLLIANRCIDVTDFKFGKGIAVYAQDNNQLRLYALGAYLKYYQTHGIDNVRMTIYQPRMANVSEHTISVYELITWANEELYQKAQIAFAGHGECKMGDWCRFCKAKTLCGVMLNEFIEIDDISRGITSKQLDEELILRVLRNGKQVKKWIDEVFALALHKAKQGEAIQGYKIVEGTSRRTYTNPNEVGQRLLQAGYKQEDVYNYTVKPLGQIEKLLGKKLFAQSMGDLVYKPEGSPTLVPEIDARGSILSNSDFETYYN